LATKFLMVRELEDFEMFKQKMIENHLMELGEYATTPRHREAIRELLDVSKEQRTCIECSIEAGAARSDPRLHLRG
jgi:hypothetical protein